jgi:hypothetical protein
MRVIGECCNIMHCQTAVAITEAFLIEPVGDAFLGSQSVEKVP